MRVSNTESQYYNCVPIRIPQFGSDPKHAVIKRPPIQNITSTWATLGANTIIGSWIHPTGIIWLVDSSGKVWRNGVNVNTIASPGTYVFFVHYFVADTERVMIYTSTRAVYHLTAAGATAVAATTYDSAVAVARPVFLDGYIFLPGNSFSSPVQRIYNTALADPTTIDVANDFLDAEMYPDTIVALAKHHNHLVAFGQNTVEFFYNGGVELGSPLQRQAAYASRVGLQIVTAAAPTHNKILEVGDKIYFIGREDNGSYGLYVIDKFRVTRISSPTMDFHINNPTYVGARNSVLGLNVNGTVCPVLQLSDAGFSTIKHIGWHPDEKEWFELFLPYAEVQTAQAWLNCINHGEYTYLQTSNYFSKIGPYAANPTEYTSYYISPLYDFNSQNMKHIKYVDVIGDFGTNVVQLKYTNDSDHGTYVSTNTLAHSSVGRNNPLRFRQLGRARRQGYKIEISGASQFVLEGLEVAYNLGTH